MKGTHNWQLGMMSVCSESKAVYRRGKVSANCEGVMTNASAELPRRPKVKNRPKICLADANDPK
jgi:hypothetical protein